VIARADQPVRLAAIALGVIGLADQMTRRDRPNLPIDPRH
jgi:hypothetical protein